MPTVIYDPASIVSIGGVGVALQAVTPGVQEVGNFHISGAGLVGSLVSDTTVQTSDGVVIDVAADGVAHNAVTLPPEDGTVATEGLWLGTNTFAGVHDPILFLGYNYAPAKAAHPRFFLGIEGNYNDVGGGHVWSEAYIERYDSDDTHSRIFNLACYDGHGEGSIRLTNFTIDLRTGTALGEVTYVCGTIAKTATAYEHRTAYLDCTN